MPTYTFSVARKKFSALLEEAKFNDVTVISKDGSLYTIKPVEKLDSPLDVPTVDIDLSREEIVDFIKQIRQSR